MCVRVCVRVSVRVSVSECASWDCSQFDSSPIGLQEALCDLVVGRPRVGRHPHALIHRPHDVRLLILQLQSRILHPQPMALPVGQLRAQSDEHASNLAALCLRES